MKDNIIFNGDGDDFKGREPHDKTLVHCEGAGGYDFTLCGLTLDGDSCTLGSWKLTAKRITCNQCIAIIRLCRTKRIPTPPAVGKETGGEG